MSAHISKTAYSPSPSKYKGKYKNTGAAPWKETYRKRCLERLKSSRDKFMSKIRNSQSIVQDLMSEEWRILDSSQSLPKLPDHIFDTDYHGNNESVDEILSVLEEIKKELLEEEKHLLEEYEKSLAFDEAAFCATIDSLTVDDIICPICKKNSLLQNKNIIFCKCGIRINTEQDCVCLSDIKGLLEQGLTEHSDQCSEEASFSVINQLGIDNLMMTCPACDFMYIVV